MSKLQFILLLLLLSCSGSKDFDETPTPIGGDNKVRSVFQQTLGSTYYDVTGSKVRLSIRINKDGVIEQVSMSQRTSNERINRTLVFALKDQIRFTPATKDGKRVEAHFEYEFNF
jgi:TonB family protein